MKKYLYPNYSKVNWRESLCSQQKTLSVSKEEYQEIFQGDFYVELIGA